MRRVRCDERGSVGITELLAAMAIFAGILAAILVSFENFYASNRDANDRLEVQDRARNASDRLARDLRNLASPTQEQPQAVDLAGPYDLVVQTVDPVPAGSGLNAANVKRVRYCLDSGARLWFQQQRWTTQLPPAMPSTATCPAAAWGSQSVVADRVVNRDGGADRPVFSFNSATPTEISSVHVDLLVDTDTARPPAAARIATGVFLRNQNRRPTAAFTATPSPQGIVLNASASVDPEGEQLTYVWFDGATKVGTGITFTYAVAAGTSHTISLKVYDAASLEGVAPAQVVIA